MGVYRDITDRKQAEDKLRAKEAELFAAAEIQALCCRRNHPKCRDSTSPAAAIPPKPRQGTISIFSGGRTDRC